MTELIDLVCGAYIVRGSRSRSAVYYCGCMTERQCVGCGQKAMSKYVRLLLASEGCGEMRTDWLV